MHELSVCQALMSQVSDIATQHNASVVESIYLQLGPLSGVEPNLLQSAFPFASANTVADKAKLIIHLAPVRIRCNSCQTESEVSSNRLVCQACGDWKNQLLSGDELILERVELCTTPSDESLAV